MDRRPHAPLKRDARIAADQDVAGTIVSVVDEIVGTVEVVDAWR
jgi:hypothetical protein